MSAAILLYHRVVERDQDPSQLCVSPERFAEQMAVLMRDWRPVRLADMAAGDRAHRAVAVTFDDGYADFLTAALPVLERAGIPTTCFITTSAVNGHASYWWDTVDRVVPAPGPRPAALEIRARGKTSVWPTITPSDRWLALHRLHRLLRRLAPGAIADVVAEVVRWSGVELSGCLNRTVDRDELARLAEHELVDVGTHTRRHPCLAALPLAEQRTEVAGSRDDLATWLGRAPDAFAYPFGVDGADWNADTRAVVQGAGFTYAVGGYGRVREEIDPLALPRHLVPDCTGRTFAAWLDARTG